MSLLSFKFKVFSVSHGFLLYATFGIGRTKILCIEKEINFKIKKKLIFVCLHAIFVRPEGNLLKNKNNRERLSHKILR
jgi:hypothetical protein